MTPTHPTTTPTPFPPAATASELLSTSIPDSEARLLAPSMVLRRSTHQIALAALVFIVAAGAWALRPIESPRLDIAIPAGSGAKAPSRTARATVDVDAFAAPLWAPPPVIARAEPPKAPAPLTPLKLQLIGITKETPTDATAGAPTVLRAALYDPDTDTLYIVAAGERVGTGRFTLASLTLETVELSDGRERRTLSLLTETHP